MKPQFHLQTTVSVTDSARNVRGSLFDYLHHSVAETVIRFGATETQQKTEEQKQML